MISKAQNKHRSCTLCNPTYVSSKTQQDFFGRRNILAQLCVDGEDLWVAHKGERQDWDGVGRLKMNPNRSP